MAVICKTFYTLFFIYFSGYKTLFFHINLYFQFNLRLIFTETIMYINKKLSEEIYNLD